ncbi:hypothetical protein K437DRAFT_293362 [Tilletiaria anomala UBC 951]|uniref:Uncharacterized protein n=1 Tax=Tilletiaria anomala (strain ATCC 24038 / CBS 436.72 / UBC 951) TaxID=1037660 RepID=A0A066WMY3_TILAU|nr:uncharacterized protein K437DRAFT_293362 [Tilletiaria anomala UBC 951]KDN51995.1 hypothetical protein K437DRAFT_293362 [Tilletiaria anomala UBC 951]
MITIDHTRLYPFWNFGHSRLQVFCEEGPDWKQENSRENVMVCTTTWCGANFETLAAGLVGPLIFLGLVALWWRLYRSKVWLREWRALENAYAKKLQSRVKSSASASLVVDVANLTVVQPQHEGSMERTRLPFASGSHGDCERHSSISTLAGIGTASSSSNDGSSPGCSSITVLHLEPFMVAQDVLKAYSQVFPPHVHLSLADGLASSANTSRSGSGKQLYEPHNQNQHQYYHHSRTRRRPSSIGMTYRGLQRQQPVQLADALAAARDGSAAAAGSALPPSHSRPYDMGVQVGNGSSSTGRLSGTTTVGNASGWPASGQPPFLSSIDKNALHRRSEQAALVMKCRKAESGAQWGWRWHVPSSSCGEEGEGKVDMEKSKKKKKVTVQGQMSSAGWAMHGVSCQENASIVLTHRRLATTTSCSDGSSASAAGMGPAGPYWR